MTLTIRKWLLLFLVTQYVNHHQTLIRNNLHHQSFTYHTDPSLGTQIGLLTTGGYLYVYGFTVLYVIIMTHVRIWAFVTMTMRASVTLHNTVFEKLTATVMRFFDTNPSGNWKFQTFLRLSSALYLVLENQMLRLCWYLIIW